MSIVTVKRKPGDSNQSVIRRFKNKTYKDPDLERYEERQEGYKPDSVKKKEQRSKEALRSKIESRRHRRRRKGGKIKN